jgi:UDP-glucuronate 4-epimerase
MPKVLLTGAAGFIGFHLAKYLLQKNYEVIGVDEINNYYNTSLKINRLKELEINHIEEGKIEKSTKYSFSFIKMSTYNRKAVETLFADNKFDYIVHLAAQAGVRHSIDNPFAYSQSNIEGFLPLLEACRRHKPKHLIFASSSSVYGNSNKIPFSEDDNVDKPISLYAATKKANELMAYTYSHLYNISITGLRFFTVYGPWGRPDMAYFKFAKAIMEDKPIDVYNNGDLKRDFTYIDDITQGIEKLLKQPSNKTPSYDIFNIGNSNPVRLMDFISILEEKMGKKAIKNFKPMQPGDVYETYASTEKLNSRIGYKPDTPLERGLSNFAAWYKSYFKTN